MSRDAKANKTNPVEPSVKAGCAQTFLNLGNPFWSAENFAFRTTTAGTNLKAFLKEIEKAFIPQIEHAFNAGWDFSECEYGRRISQLKKEIARLKAQIEEHRQALENQQQFIDELMTIDWEGE